MHKRDDVTSVLVKPGLTLSSNAGVPPLGIQRFCKKVIPRYYVKFLSLNEAAEFELVEI